MARLGPTGLTQLCTDIKNWVLGKIPTKTSQLTNDSNFLTSHQSLSNYSTLANTVKSISISGKTITVTPGSGSAYTLTTQDTNTDTLVTQNVSTANNTYPILLCATANATANQGAKTSIFGANALINPSTGEITSKSNGIGAFRVVGGNYGFFIRNDGTNTYFLLTASGDQYGTWTSARPLTISNANGTCSINGNAATANKLATARNIALGNEFMGSSNFDGSGNITINGSAYLSVVDIGNKNNYPYHCFAKFGPITSKYQDAAIKLLVSRQYINGGTGIIELEFRTNNTNQDGECAVRWITRSSKISVDCIQVGFYKTWGGIYADVFYKSSGAYDSCVIRSMGDGSRASYERRFTLQDSNEANNTTTSDPLTSVNSYASIAAAGTALHNQAYTNTITATDGGVVGSANACTGNAATATKLATARAINGTNFDGSAAITTANWGTARNIYIADSDATNTGAAVSVNGSGNATLKLPATIKASITGNCSGSSGSCTGNAATATQFSSNATVTLTGDATGTSAGSKKSWSVPVTLANSGVTAGTYGPSADVTGNNNSTISVPQITVDAKGRVTSVVNRTLTCKNNTYSVYNKTLTIQKNGTNVATFTSNSNTDVTANITVPTKTSELTNDSGFLTSHQSLSNYVTLNTAQTISGIKSFSTHLRHSSTNTRGTAPSANESRSLIDFRDSAGNSIARLLSVYNTDKSSLTDLHAYKTTAATGGSIGSLGIGCDASGNVYTVAPTPATADNSTKIATTAFVKAQGYLTSHQSLSNYVTLNGTQTISGAKTFSHAITSSVVSTSWSAANSGTAIINSTGAAGTWAALAKMNSTNGYFTLGSYGTGFYLNYTVGTETSNKTTHSVKLLDENGTAAFPGAITAATPAATDSSTKVATTAWVNSKGYITSVNAYLENTTARDANTIDNNGITYYNSNGPATSLGASTTDGALFTQFHNSKWIAQIAQDYRNGNLFTRGKNNNAWQAWKAVAYRGDNVSKFNNDAGYITGSGNTTGSSGSCTGNAATATQFSSNATVALTGDATGTSAGSKKGWSVPVTLANSGVTAGSYGPSAAVSPGHNGTFSVPYITVDAKGRVTAASSKTITLPADSNTDTKVTQTVTTGNSYYPVILGHTEDQTATETSVARFSKGFLVNARYSFLYIRNTYNSENTKGVRGTATYTNALQIFQCYDGTEMGRLFCESNKNGYTRVSLRATNYIKDGAIATDGTATHNGLSLDVKDDGSKHITIDGNWDSNLTPAANNSKTLGTSSLKWKAAYAVNFYENGTALSSKYAQIANISADGIGTTCILAYFPTGTSDFSLNAGVTKPGTSLYIIYWRLESTAVQTGNIFEDTRATMVVNKDYKETGTWKLLHAMSQGYNQQAMIGVWVRTA